MTTPAPAGELGGRLPTEREKAAANQLRQILASHAAGNARLWVLDEQTKPPTEIALALVEPAHRAASTRRSWQRCDAHASRRNADDPAGSRLLNVTRLLLVSLLDKGEIPQCRAMAVPDLHKVRWRPDQLLGRRQCPSLISYPRQDVVVLAWRGRLGLASDILDCFARA